MEEIAAMFKALSDPTRLRIYEFLRHRCCALAPAEDEGAPEGAAGPTVGSIYGEVNVGSTTVSHHLKELRNAGLIRMERSGKNIICCVNKEAQARLAAYLDSTNDADNEGCC